MRAVAMLCILGILLSGCGLYGGVVDEDKVATEANKVLKALYLDKDYHLAYDLCGEAFKQQASPQTLKDWVEKFEGRFGRLKSLRAVSFLPIKEGINIFYEGTGERGKSYHNLFLVGNMIKGYKVVGIDASEKPYKGKFIKYNKNIVVE